MNIDALKTFTDKISHGYGTEDKSIFIYSLIKMYRSRLMLEFGTGSGAVMLWAGKGFKENGRGSIITFDNGREWDNNDQFRNNIITQLGETPHEYSDYVNTLRQKFNVESQTKFINSQIELSSKYIRSIIGEQPIDIIFSDFDHGPQAIFDLFANIVPLMSSNGTLLIDSASTSVTSYLFLETIVKNINSNLPISTLENTAEDIELMRMFYRNHELKLTHIIENKERDQNSIAMVQVTSRDILPCEKYLLRL